MRRERRRKRHNPPGILDWLYDWLVKPIVFGMISLAYTFINEIDTLKPGATIGEVLTAFTETAKEILPIPPGVGPEEAADLSKDHAQKQTALADRINQIILLAEAASLGQVDIGVQGLTTRPDYRASQATAEKVLSARFEHSLSPLLRRHWLKHDTPLLPGYADMISIYVREGHLEEKWVEIPDEFVEYMKELGTSEFWTKRLWGKHWVLPGVELLYDMFGKKIIDHETLTMMLKFHDFEPVWRDRLIKNAYALIPRVDLRRAYMYRIPGFEDLTERYEKLRYSPDDARTMDTIAKRFALTRYYTRLETVARAAFRKRRLTEAGLREVLVRINTPEAAIPLIIEAETLARGAAVREVAEEPSTPGRTDMRWMAEWGLIGLPELTGFLEADGMDPAWAPLVAETWMLNQLRDELGKVRGVYEDLLEAGFMSKPDFEVALRGLHFAPHVVDALVRWADARLDLDEKKELAKEYETLAKEEIITVQEYGQALRGLGMVEERITRRQHHIELLLGIKAAKEAAKEKG